MFVRIVKLTFKEEHIDQFLYDFNENKQNIRHFEGCQFLELYRDKTDTSIFFTYSYWNSEDDLENYRKSVLFRGIWSKIKPLFDSPAEAWSVDKLESLN